MKIDLTDTTSSKINSGLVEARRAIGGLPAGSVLTLIVVADEEGAYDAVQTAAWATRQHSSRILVVIRRTDRGPRSAGTRLDAEIRVGSDAGTGETVLLRLHGELASQAQSAPPGAPSWQRPWTRSATPPSSRRRSARQRTTPAPNC